MIIDIDDFKGINDTHGHNVGDNVLVELVDVLMSHIRDADVLARWGGDEFVILLHMTEEEGIKTMAEHLRRTIERYRFKDVGHLTCSFGIAEVGGQANLESAIALADKALYQAKQKGKNGVTYTKDGATFC